MPNTSHGIKGYRNLSKEEIEIVNAIKELGEVTGKMFDDLDLIEIADPRWLAISKTHFQQGFMALTRSVLKPDTFA